MSQKASQAGVEVRLLGELEVLHRGRPQALPASKKSRALLAYLVSTGRPHLREALCALLWDGPDDPRAELRWCLSKIRPLLDAGGGSLAADRERIGYVAGPVKVDTSTLRELVGRGTGAAATEDLRAAAAVFRGELLEGLEMPNCFRYYEWCVGERERVRALRTGILAELVARHSAGNGDLDEALRWARERLRFDPLTEGAHVDVIRILGRLGRTRDALAQYDACQRILESELGVRGSPALERARRDLTAPNGPLETARADAPGSVSGAGAQLPAGSQPIARPPLVGRDGIRSAVVAALRSAGTAGSPPALLLVGDPGIGKTRLLDLVADETRAAGGTVLRGRAFEAETVRPYGPWIDALAAANLPASVEPGPDLAPLFPAIAPAAVSSSPPGDRGRLHDALAALLVAWSNQAGPLAVILDDVQWLDEASASLLHFVARGASGSRLVIACAARAGELGDNPAALRVVRALDRERHLVQHVLGPLGAAETAAVVRAIDPAADVDAAFASSEGNPLFAIEIARAAAAGAARGDESLHRLLDDRLERLGDAARGVLPWAAALGRSFDPEVLASILRKDPPELLAIVEHLERHGVLRPASGGHCDFTHDLLRQAAYRRLSQPRRRLVHLQIARALQATHGGDDALASEIAHHAALGGDALLAARSAVSAGQRCLRVFAHAEAAELATRGLQHLARIEKNARIRLEIELFTLLVDSGLGARRRPSLEADLSRAIVEAQEAGLHAEAALGFRARSVLYYTGERFDAARDSSIRAVDESRRTDAAARGRELAETARCLLLLENEVPRASAMIDEARALLGADAGRIARLAWATGLLARYTGDRPAAASALDAAIEGFEREHAHWERFQAMAQRVLLELERGSPAEALARCGPLAEVATRMAEGSELAVAGALAALAHRALALPGTADGVEGAIQGLAAADAKAMLAYVLNATATADLAAGDAAAADRHASAALAAAEAVGRRSEVAVARSLLGRAALARGEVAWARDHLDASSGDRASALGLSRRAAAAVDELAAALAAATDG